MVMDDRNQELLKYLGQLDASHGGVVGNHNKGHKFPPEQMKMLTMNKIGRVRLDAEGCISLSNVLHSFTAGVNEEQAWALCYQIIKAAQILLSRVEDRDQVLLVTETDHVKLHQDGSVHKNTFLDIGPEGKGKFVLTFFAYTYVYLKS
jgi:hypothetical protein